MSNPIEFNAEWEAVAGTRGIENRATWARFSLWVNGYPVTRALDHRAKSYRDQLMIPLYPVTEWMVTHWWSLLYEAETPWAENYAARHDLRLGREGYAFPDLFFKPMGNLVELHWKALDLPPVVSFPASGSATIEREALQEALTHWVDLVVARLEQQGVSHTLLQDEWEAIQGGSGDEQRFCIAAAQLGQDPFCLSEPLIEQIVWAAQALPSRWHDEFFSAVRIDRLADEAEYARKARQTLQEQRRDLQGLVKLRGQAGKLDPRCAPWQQGYEVARWLRRERQVEEQPLATDAALANLLDIDELPLLDPGLVPASRWMDALVEADDSGTGGFISVASRAESRRFSFCRALCEYLTDVDTPSALITVARNGRQKRNRAFAAELLAPAEWLRHRYAHKIVEYDEIQESADELGVSGEVIHRQLENHRIARLTD